MTDLSVMRVEIRDELLSILREPTALFFSVLMPVGLFALFASLFAGGTQETAAGIPAGADMLARFGTYAVLAVTLMNPGVGVAEDRDRGWLRAKQVTAVPLGITIGAKVAATFPYAIAVLVAMAGAAAAMGSLDVPLVTVGRLMLVLLIGALPFALVGLAVGFQAGGNATVAILNAALFPMAIASGLWMPLEILPGFAADVAPFLPTYHLSQLATAQLDGTGGVDHLLVLLATSAVAAVVTGWSYRHART